VDSRLEENGRWYSRFHIGPFCRGSRLQIGTRLRRSLLNDLTQTLIIAVKLEGAIHEFSRLSGVHENTLDLLFQFRKVVLDAPYLKINEMVTIPFIFFGPGIFYAKDISWPNRVCCRNPKTYLVTLSPGAIIRGRLIIKKGCPLNLRVDKKNLINLGKTFPVEEEKIFSPYPWLSLGYQNSLMKRVGFRIESLEILSQQNEILIFEIFTNGRISPRQALREASFMLAYKFSSIAYIITPFIKKDKYTQIKKKDSFSFKKKFINIVKLKKKNNIILNNKFPYFQEPFNLNLGNLDLSKERYGELQDLGIKTLGQFLERLTFESHIFSNILKKQRQQSLFYLGFFSLLIFMINNLFFTKVVGRRKKAVANLELIPGSGKIQINKCLAEQFFSDHPKRLLVIQKPFFISTYLYFNVKVTVKGGGLTSQAEAIKLALARALVNIEPEIRKIFRENYLLTCDSREKERRKYGLKKARKAPQFSKR
jgi:small subunit ribosomal protein S9